MSKKLLISTALVFALLAGKSIATENKPFESEDVPSTSLVISPFSDLSEDTTIQVASHLNGRSFASLALTSTDNYRSANKIIQHFRPDLRFNFYKSTVSSTFYDTIESHYIRDYVEQKAQNGGYKDLKDIYFLPIGILKDMYDLCETRGYSHASMLEKKYNGFIKDNHYQYDPHLKNGFFNEDFYILVSYVKASNKIYDSTESNFDIISNYMNIQKELSDITYPLKKYYLKKETEVLELRLSERLSVKNSRSEIIANAEVQKYLLDKEQAETEMKRRKLKLLVIKAMTKSDEEFLAHPHVQTEIQNMEDEIRQGCAQM